MTPFYPHVHVLHAGTGDTVYQGALRFITNADALTYHCTLHVNACWPSLARRSISLLNIHISKGILGLITSRIDLLLSVGSTLVAVPFVPTTFSFYIFLCTNRAMEKKPSAVLCLRHGTSFRLTRMKGLVSSSSRTLSRPTACTCFCMDLIHLFVLRCVICCLWRLVVTCCVVASCQVTFE